MQVHAAIPPQKTRESKPNAKCKCGEKTAWISDSFGVHSADTKTSRFTTRERGVLSELLSIVLEIRF